MRAGYEELLDKLLNRAEGESLEEAVETNYDQVDIQFLTLLNQKVRRGSVVMLLLVVVVVVAVSYTHLTLPTILLV